MSIAITISFACYFPVVLLAKKANDRDADDAQNHGIHLDDQYGTRADRESILKEV